MTAALVVAIYLLALACFLGLDIFGKTIPPTGYGRVAGALGAITGAALIAGVHVYAPGHQGWLKNIGLGLAAAACSGAIAALWQRRGPPAKKLTPPGAPE